MDTIGTSPARSEDIELLTGGAAYVGDLTGAEIGDGTGIAPAHAVFVRSPLARARIVSIDIEEARAAPGVIAVHTATTIGVRPGGPLTSSIPALYAQPVLADRHVRFAGEAVAVVVAETEAAAVDAAELVAVDFEAQQAVVDPVDAATDTELVFNDETRVRLRDGVDDQPLKPTNTVDHLEHRVYPDPDAELFADCPVRVSGRFTIPRQSPAPIEPRVMTCHWDEQGHVHVHAATQRPHGFRDQLVDLFELRPDQIHVSAGTHVGGGFGGKTSRGIEEHALVAVARLVGRPVRWAETRSEYLLAATQGRGEQFEITVGGGVDGTLIAVDVRMLKDNGAYPTTCAFLPRTYTRANLSGCYRFERIGFESRSVVTNLATVSAFRGAGRAAYLVALEQMVDRFANTIGLDPVEIRRRNLIPADAMPYTTPTGSIYDPADYRGDLETALATIDYDALRLAQTVHDDSPLAIGIGVSCYNHMTVGGGGEEAIVSITDDGGATVFTGTTDQGHGHRTTWAQIAAESLGIALDRIEVKEGSTHYTDSGMGAVGSRSLQTAGVAIHNACDAVVDRARSVAGDLLEAAVDDVIFDPSGGAQGRFHVVGTPARWVGWPEVASRAALAPEPVELTCGDLHDVDGANSFPSGCHIAVVEVDRETGRVRLVRYVAVDDAGRRVNPMIVDGQLHGGIAAGIGQALGEEMVYDDAGNLLTGTFGSYPIVTADVLPSFELVPADVASSFNRGGYKGVGESGTVGATPAVYNAVIDALRPYGVTELQLPCSPERVWQALQAVGTATSSTEPAAGP